MSKDKKHDSPCTTVTEEYFKKEGYTIGKQLNYGSYSKVYLGKIDNKNYKKDVAVKVIDLDKTSTDYRTKFLPRELYVLRKLRHPNIVSIYEIFQIGAKVYIFMELATGGDILDLLKAKGPLGEPRSKVLFKESMDGLAFVHKYGITHRDLKIENILLDKDGHAKITDFGFSRTVYDATTGKRQLSETYCGSAAYCAPEIIKNTPYNPQLSDIWSMGVVLFLMINDTFPFEDSDLTKMLAEQTEKKWKHVEAIEAQLSGECKDLVKRMLEPDTSKRITMTKVLEHPWLAGVKNETPNELKLTTSDEELKVVPPASGSAPAPAPAPASPKAPQSKQ